MFCYERDADQALVLAAGIPAHWLDGGQEVGASEAPTYWGTVSYRMRKVDQTLHVSISGEAQPPGGIAFESPLSSPVRSASVNGIPISVLTNNTIVVRSLPAEIIMAY